MTKLEICAIEDSNPGQIYLYPEGAFYKAYQRSAWLGEGHYGRYVDDAYVVGWSSAELRRVIPLAEGFLQDNLGLSLNWNKIAIYWAYRGVEFLGA